MKIGKQYAKDDAFKKEARLHQSKYRANELKVDFSEYGNRLLDENANLNYYPKLGVLEDLRKRYPKYSKKRDADMLRSEHIPFNVFSPLKLDLELAKNVFNKFVNNIISEITKINVEFAPSPKGNYLNDGTSFDTYFEFIHKDGTKGGIGIEVKYTEQAYSLGKIEKKSIANLNSLYYLVTKNSHLYLEDTTKTLIKDDYRQLWRNHILGESMKQHKDINHFISLILYPSGNTHFSKVIPKYLKLLNPKKQNLFVPVTFKDLFDAYSDLSNNITLNNWIAFLEKRYIIK